MKILNPLMTAAVVAAMLGVAGTAAAGGTHTVSVSATVTGVCIVPVSDQTSTLGFGSIDGSMAGPFNATWSGGNFRCTNGTTYTVTSNDGLWESASGGASNRMKLSTAANCSTASDCIRYTMTNATTGTGSGMTTNISFNVTGQTTAADIASAAAGSYADTVTLTVSP